MLCFRWWYKVIGREWFFFFVRLWIERSFLGKYENCLNKLWLSYWCNWETIQCGHSKGLSEQSNEFCFIRKSVLQNPDKLFGMLFCCKITTKIQTNFKTMNSIPFLTDFASESSSCDTVQWTISYIHSALHDVIVVKSAEKITFIKSVYKLVYALWMLMKYFFFGSMNCKAE